MVTLGTRLGLSRRNSNAFTTVLGTVSGLILASSGAVTHDLMGNVMGMEMTDTQQVRVAKLASIVVGLVAIVLGILFQELNVSYLVGWAFSGAASANLPSLVMCLLSLNLLSLIV